MTASISPRKIVNALDAVSSVKDIVADSGNGIGSHLSLPWLHSNAVLATSGVTETRVDNGRVGVVSSKGSPQGRHRSKSEAGRFIRISGSVCGWGDPGRPIWSTEPWFFEN